MNAKCPVSNNSKLLRLLKPQPAYYLHNGHLCTEPDPRPPPPPAQDDESKITQAVQLIIETPHQEWSSSQPLRSILFSSPSPSPSFLSKITCSIASYRQALNFFKHLQQNFPFENTQFLSYPFQALVEQAGREVEAGSRLSELYQASKEWEIPPTVNTATLFIQYFGRLNMVDKSVIVFNELDPSLKSTHVRNVLIEVLLRDGRVEYALNVLDEMLQPLSEVPPDDITGDIIFYGLVKGDRKGTSLSVEEIIKLVLKFGKCSVFPKTNWLTQLISRLCGSGKLNQAWDVLRELLRLRAPLETPPFNVLLTGLGKNGDAKRMSTVLAVMRESDIQPDVVTFGILINQLCKLGKVDDAMEVLKNMGEGSGSDGVSVEADIIIFNTVINGLCKQGRQEEGLHLMERMRSMKGLEPHTVTYNCLIAGFCKVGEIERGKALFDQMNEEGVSPNVITLNTLVDGMCRHGRINSAVEFFIDMQGKGLKGNAVTYTTLIIAFCNVDNIIEAVDLFDQMLRSGCPPDAVVYYNLISALCKAGRMDDASNVLSKLKEAGFHPDIVCYNALLSGFCNKNKVGKAYEIIKEMEEAGMNPNSVSYNTLIAYFCKTGDFALACRVMKHMTKEGLVPTIPTYGALIHAYCLNGKIKEALKLFNDMSSISKISPNTITYNILIESLCKNNNVKDALSLMDDMKAKGVKPNTTTYNAMFKGLKENNLLEDAFRLMDCMIEHACNPDYITVEILTEWLSAVGESGKLKSFVQGYKVSTFTS
ncbi:pentatricopeptide repeat-containing protein At3g61520, mitochondrial-like isoform X2 [Durio zibethinus]|uniref:Pentatricopeptide repeat-containing protein At3g61520, mitochondrial-like isoform X2 n=1 Tax=Durio zibethinus TaxID=66656 RepID=A0A6P6B049_DURZI|nr:pentatricopeptide repeat-containing protein At3g61520, mitochondrial-like isoform X2 [Durio zibethinus]